MTNPGLDGQRVVIVGGSSGIGYAVAEAVIGAGGAVTIGSSSPERTAAATARLGERARGETIDVRSEESVAAFFASVGAFDHLVFTAGDWGPGLAAGPVGQVDVEAARGMLDVRFWGAVRAVKHAQAYIAPTGSITLTSGVLAHRPQKGAPLGTAMAAASENLARALAVDLAPVRVNSVCPGLVLTDRWAQAPAETLAKYTQRQLIARPCEPEEAALTYLHLMLASYTTGQVLVVDGGRTLL